MALVLTQSATAVGTNAPASFLGVGGTGALVYSVLPSGGVTGTVNSATGFYKAPATVNSNPDQLYDTIRVTDSLGAKATARILVGTPLLLFCDIIQHEMELADGRVYLWDQKIMQPTDNDLYIAVSVGNCKAFGSSNVSIPTAGGLTEQLSVNMLATLGVDIISRGPAARDRKEEVVMALASTYSQQQQTSNSFYIATLPTSIVNLSDIDGAAIPYRFHFSINMQYAQVKTKANQFFDTFTDSYIVNE